MLKKKSINENPDIFSKLIEFLFYTECSLLNLPKAISLKEDEYKDKTKKYKILTQQILKDTITTTFTKGIKYNKFIDIIKNDSIHNSTQDTNEEMDEEEEESQDYNNVCDELENMITNYKTVYYSIDNYPLEIDIIEKLWCLQEFMTTKNYDIIDVEILLFNDTDIIEEFNKQTILFKTELTEKSTAKSSKKESTKSPVKESAKSSKKESIKSPIEESAKSSKKESTKSPIEKSSESPESPTEDTIKPSENESAKSPTEDTIKLPVDQSSSPVDESVKPSEE